MNGKMKMILMALVAMVLAGCATRYHLERTFADGSSITVSAYSFRDMEQPQLNYTRKGADEVSFNFQAQALDNNTDVTAGAAVNLAAPFMNVAAGVLQAVLNGQLVPAGTVTPPLAPGN